MKTYLLQSFLVMAMLYLPYLLWFRHRTFFSQNRLYLLISFVAALVAPFVARMLDLTVEAREVMWLQPIVFVNDLAPALTVAGKDISTTNVWLIMYMIVAIVLLARVLRQVAQIGSYYLRGERSVQDGVVIVRHSEIESPFSFFRYIFLPASISESHADASIILEHEKAHISKFHSIDTCILEVVCALLWINPMVYLYRIALKTIHEYEADNAVCASSNKTRYARLLLDASQPGIQFQLSHTFITSQLKSRIIMIMKKRSSRSALLTYALAVPIFIFAFALLAFQNPVAQSSDEAAVEVQLTDPDNQDVLKVAEQMPRFPGCENEAEEIRNKCSVKKLMGYIIENLKYPAEAEKAKLEGKVAVKFVVQPNGLISGIKIVKELSPECDAEVIRVVESMNSMPEKWIPGKQSGKDVAVEMVLPVVFAL